MNKLVAMAVNLYNCINKDSTFNSSSSSSFFIQLTPVANAGYVQVIMADIRAAFYLPSSFTQNQISALSQLAT